MQKLAAWIVAALLLVTPGLVTSVSAATAYTSPTYGFTISLPDEWTVQSESSQNGTDVLRFTNGPVVAFLTSYPTTQTPAECIEAMVETIEQRPGHDNFAFAAPIQEANGSATAVLGYTFITAAGEQLEGRNRMTCWSLPDAGAMVRLELLLLSRDVTAQEAAMSAVELEVASAVVPLGTPLAEVPEASPLATVAVVEPSPTATVEATEASPTEETGATETAIPTETEIPTPSATQTPETATETPTQIASVPTETPIVPTETATIEETEAASPTEAGDESALEPALEPGVTENSYVSPGFGYGLTWSPEWTVAREESDARGDYLGLEHADGIFADLIGEPFSGQGTCFDYIVDYYTQQEDYQNVLGNVDATSAAPGLWEFTGTITLTLVTEAGTELEMLNYIACSHVPDRPAIVSLEQIVMPSEFQALQPEMDALRQGFILSAASPGLQTSDPAVTATPEAIESPQATVQASPSVEPGGETASAVSGNTYTSPTYGYELTWDDTWSVIGESTENGEDYLNLSNEVVTAELLSEKWTPGEENCFEWIVSFYANHPDYSDVRASQDAVSAVPGVWDYTGAIALNLTVADNRPAGERINYVACSEIPGEQVIVSLEQFVWPIDAPGQLAAMDALREGFSLEGA